MILEIPVEVQAGPLERMNGIVSKQVNFNQLLWYEGIESKFPPLSLSVWEHSGSDAVQVTSQLFEDTVYWIMPGRTKANSIRRFKFRLSDIPDQVSRDPPKKQITVKDMDDKLVFIGHSRELCRYKYKNVWKPYFHPVQGPDGEVTRGEVYDGEGHHFHHGVWFAYGSMEAEGVNIWAESEKIVARRGMTGKITHDKFELTSDGALFALFREKLNYQKPDGFVFAKELRTVFVYEPDENHSVIDITIRLEEPEDFGERRLILAGRVAQTMRIRDLTSYVPSDIPPDNSHAVMRDDPGKIEYGSGWVDFSGRVGTSWNGISLIDHPENAETSTIAAQEYGLITITRNYPGNSIYRGGAVQLKYRIFIHKGDAVLGRVEGAASDFHHPCLVHFINQ